MHLDVWLRGWKAAYKNMEKIKKILVGNWWVGENSCRGCGKRGPELEEAGGENGRNEIIIWMEVADNGEVG